MGLERFAPTTPPPCLRARLLPNAQIPWPGNSPASKSVLLDITPLRRHRDYRLVFLGQTVSSFGTFLTYVALPVQIYRLTNSSGIVGLVSAAQFIPLACTALWGGAFADAFDRRRLLLLCEVLLLCGSL